MGSKFVKDVLYPGTYRLSDGRLVTYTPADVKGMAERLNEWKGLGLHVPASWAHQAGAKPTTEQLAAKEKNILGYADESRLTADGAAEIVLDVPDDEDAKQVPKVRFVSPEIVRDWIDGDGKLWPGPSITHIAFTSRPVQHRQNAPVKLSHDTVWLSLGDVEMAEDKGGKKGESETPADGPNLKKILKVLAAAGINLPDDTNDGNFMDRLYTAAIAKEGNTSGSDLPDTTAEATTDAGAPMLMALQARAERAERALIRTARGDLARRIDGLVRRGVPKDVRQKLREKLQTEQLSLDPEGQLQSSILARVEAYEALPIQLSQDGADVSVVERPTRDDERDDAATEKLRQEAKERAKLYSKAGAK